MRAYGIRFHGKRWLKIAKPHPPETPQIGWRPFFWTKDAAEAEKFGSETQAAAFAALVCFGPFEVAEFPSKSPFVDRIA